jgi:hypothetical protein
MASSLLDDDAKPKVVFITGQQDCTKDDFDCYYCPAIEDAIKHGYHFVIGNAAGVDAFARALLWDVHRYAAVTIYDKGNKKGNIPEGSGWKLKNGFDTYPDRDYQMILDSDKIICYLFGNSGGTGTHLNLLRFFASKLGPPRPRVEDLSIHPDLVLKLNRMCHRGGPFDCKDWTLAD